MITFPKAKINFGLRITRRRSDGYHDIESIFYPIGLCDALEFCRADTAATEDQMVVTGLEIPPSNDENLVIKALKIFRESYPVPYLKIHLHKAIPCGGGLGGGSSDGSYFLKTINRHFGFGATDIDLKEMAIRIGSDCPFFIDSVPALAKGRGELLQPLPEFLKGMHIVLLHPKVAVSTKEAYKHCIPCEHERSLSDLVKEKPSRWKDLVINDFEDYAFKLHPRIGELKKSLYHSGALYSTMTGSGSAIYGIFANPPSLPPTLSRYKIFEGEL